MTRPQGQHGLFYDGIMHRVYTVYLAYFPTNNTHEFECPGSLRFSVLEQLDNYPTCVKVTDGRQYQHNILVVRYQ